MGKGGFIHVFLTLQLSSYYRIDEGLDDVVVLRQHGTLVELRPNNHTECGRNMDDLGKTCTVDHPCHKGTDEWLNLSSSVFKLNTRTD